MSRVLSRLAGLAGLLLVLEVPAHAYLDPGSGSMLLQLLLGGVAAGAVALRMLWQRLTGRVTRPSDQAPQSSPTER